MSNKTLCVITSKAPYGSLSAKEALDTALVGAAFDLDVSLLFNGDGVFQLLNNQDPTPLEQKRFSAALPALELYGIEKILVCHESLKQRGLVSQDLLKNIQLVTPQEIAIHLNTTDMTLSF